MSVGLFASLLILAQPLVGEAVETEILVSGLDHPWAVAELPDGDLLVTEKPGGLRWIHEGALIAAPVSGTPDVLYSGQGGLLDLVLHPDYAENGWLYLTWTEGTRRDNTLKLGRARFEAGALTDFETIFVVEPNRSSNVHYGARMTFLPDNSLLLAIGEGFDFREEAQRPDNYLGTIIRLADDGTPFPPEVEDGAPGVYSYGHRNPQALLVDPETGVVWQNEHGPRGGDEINRIEPGANYGWPIVSLGIDYTGALVTPFDHYGEMTDPVLAWVPSIAPSSMEIYRGEMFADWQGDLLVTALIRGDAPSLGGHLRRVEMVDGEPVAQYVYLGDIDARLRDVFVASDGSLLVLTDEDDGQLIRVTPR